MKNEFISFVDKIHTSFIARDISAKVIPGFILLTNFGYIFFSSNDMAITNYLESLLEYLNNFSIFDYILLYSLSYIAGFFVQALAELCKWFRSYPNEVDERIAFKTIYRFHKLLDSKESIKGDIFLPEFAKYSKLNEERLVVIMELSGNMSFCLFIFGVSLISLCLWKVWSSENVLLGSLLLITGLLFRTFHVSNRKRRWRLVEAVIQTHRDECTQANNQQRTENSSIPI